MIHQMLIIDTPYFDRESLSQLHVVDENIIATGDDEGLVVCECLFKLFVFAMYSSKSKHHDFLYLRFQCGISDGRKM